MATQLQKLKTLSKKYEDEKKEIEKTVYYDDLLLIVDQLTAYVKDVANALKSENAETTKQLTADIAEALKKAEDIYKKFSEIVSSENKLTRETSESDRRTTMRYIDQKFDDLILPKEYDDKIIVERLDAITDALLGMKIPDAFDATELTTEIESIKRDVEEMKKRPTGGRGGQLTDKALVYAMGRMVKTETPTGAINGVNTDYTVTSQIHAVLGFMLNGEAIALSNYSITGGKRMTISFSSALPAAYSGKDFEIIYI